MRPDVRPGDIPDLDGGVSAEPLRDGPGTQGPTGSPSRVVIGPEDVDSDGDGRPDTVMLVDSADLGAGFTLYTDLDGDGLADQVLRIAAGPQPEAPPPVTPPDGEPVWWQPWTWFPD